MAGPNRTYKVMQDLTGYFRTGQREAIYNACKTDRDKLIIKLLWKTGRRIGEVLLIKIKDLDFEQNNILWNIEKKKKEHRAWKPIDSETMEQVKLYVEKEGLTTESFLFPSNSGSGHITRQWVFNVVRKACADCGINYVGGKQPHPHHFRHSFAIEKARKMKSPADLRKLQMYMEHATIDMTQNYLQFGDEEMRSLVEDE